MPVLLERSSNVFFRIGANVLAEVWVKPGSFVSQKFRRTCHSFHGHHDRLGFDRAKPSEDRLGLTDFPEMNRVPQLVGLPLTISSQCTGFFKFARNRISILGSGSTSNFSFTCGGTIPITNALRIFPSPGAEIH